jgi:4-diphosphocytidyl-2-C-methyl-D-erythritol kinase
MTIPALFEIAYAKINLALHVRKRRDDGYHELETLFAFAEEGDLLVAEEADGLELAIDGPFAEDITTGDDNIIIKAAAMLRDRAGVSCGARLRLTKNLPVAAGLGGGSADAGAALRLLQRLWNLGLTGSELLYHSGCFDPVNPLGADIPACFASRTSRGEGIGDELRFLDNALSGTPLLLVNPRIAVSTASIFNAWDGIDRGRLAEGVDILNLSQNSRNDLTPMALAIAPEIGAVLAKLQDLKETSLVRMSGSGATCFALFDSESARDRGANVIKSAHPDWWTMLSKLR